MLSKLANGVLAAGLAAGVSGAFAQNAPIRVGGTLALTGPLAQTALVHKIAADVYIDQLNARGGLLGRKMEYLVYDDASKPDQSRTLYDKLVTVDKVDLIVGPYATASILAAMSVAERYRKIFPHNTFGLPRLAKYEAHVPVGAMGYTPEVTFPTLAFDALEAGGKKPGTVAIVTSKFPSVHFVSVGARDIAKQKGVKEVLYLEYEFGSRDFGPIAARIKDANPDLLFIGAIGLEGNMILEALKKIEYSPKNHFHLFPSPGPLAVSPDGKNALSVSTFEDHAPFTANPVGAQFAREFRERATKANLPYPIADMQSATQYAMWQVIEAAVTATRGLDDKALTEWIRKNEVDTIIGKLAFNGPNNYGPHVYKIKQVQDGKWVVVFPQQFAAPGAKIVVQ